MAPRTLKTHKTLKLETTEWYQPKNNKNTATLYNYYTNIHTRNDASIRGAYLQTNNNSNNNNSNGREAAAGKLRPRTKN